MTALKSYRFRRVFKRHFIVLIYKNQTEKIGQGVQTKQMIRMCIMQLD